MLTNEEIKVVENYVDKHQFNQKALIEYLEIHEVIETDVFYISDYRDEAAIKDDKYWVLFPEIAF